MANLRRWLFAYTAALTTAGVLAAALPAAQAPEQAKEPLYKNLKVLPKDISRDELSQIMLDNLSGLGLPRRAGEGCLFCHAGTMDVPRQEWDYASDEKPMKQKARVMMEMVRSINEGHLSKLEGRAEPRLDVSCYTCHAARTNPMPLTQLLIAEHKKGGAEAIAQMYRRLRERYYEADAYDFRVSTLIDVANGLTVLGADDDAAAVHELNIEFFDEPRAHGGLILLRMLQTLKAVGIDAMVERYHALKKEHPASAFNPGLLDPLAWGLFRGNQRAAGFRLFELGFAEYPDAYSSTENLAWGCQAQGDHERAMKLAEAWVAAHPDHELGLRLVAELKQAEASKGD